MLETRISNTHLLCRAQTRLSILSIPTSSLSVADSTPTCSNDTLTSAQSSIDSGCSSDISDGGSSGTEVSALKGLLAHYTEFQAAACSTNTSTSDYCVTETLTTIQNAVGGNLTTSDVTSLLSGSNSSNSSSNSSIASVFTTGQLCTDCVNGMCYEALQANSSIAGNIIDKGLTSKCCSDFGTKAPDTASSASSSSASSANTSSSSSSAGSVATPFVGLLATAGIAGSVLGALVFGAASVL
ncbi:hypothetical protein L198_05131 [Cryptococcus wingfieldii CBS 7118]|uniref:Uncharacterized protein n=1 Tax=Cryptococcus wingfieldii CBS 7118 TaxID=1295528 RepID=A0A1E3J0U1_9TREE|nr:hypothetical protein L198_05131 [Cryptococcus wingfieldii CBS 7118]ODN94275.1 hypothetical protein L198_05131 [Cryptococcus wingfieldii CBS 7118]